MRTLPKHIYANTGGGYVVRIKRGDVKLTFCTRDLAAAVAARDRFLALHGRIAIPRPKSNTGVTGISEVTKWFHSKPYDCFSVTAGHPRKGVHRFFYRTLADRPRAWREAVAARARLLGVTEAEVTKGVLCE